MMSVSHPQIPKEILKIDDFLIYAQRYLAEEALISDIECCGDKIEGESFSNLEIRKSVFNKCVFNDCGFDNASFIDVVFESCDLSNSSFAGAFFERCSFLNCKCVGADISVAIIKHTVFEQSNFKYSNFNKIKMTDVKFKSVDFADASMSEASLKKFEAEKSNFLRNNFFKTMLDGVDFTDNELAEPTVSSPPFELKGAVINTIQAAELIRLWGVIVK